LLVPAACGGDGDADADQNATPPPASRQASTVYERAYSECSSTELDLLAGKYNVSPNRTAIAQAVGAAWVDTLGAGPSAVDAGVSGCRDGFDARVSDSSS
jgi:hypothetical protein